MYIFKFNQICISKHHTLREHDFQRRVAPTLVAYFASYCQKNVTISHSDLSLESRPSQAILTVKILRYEIEKGLRAVYVRPIYQHSDHHYSNCQKVSLARTQICCLNVTSAHFNPLVKSAI